MKEAEKEAERIIEMFYDKIEDVNIDCGAYCMGGSFDRMTLTIQCALLHVEGIIEANPTVKDWDTMSDGTKEIWHVCNISYWQEVKQIITNKQV